MMCKELQKLADNRKNLLQAEIAAWLHMIGKYQKAFVEGKIELAHQVPDMLKHLKDKRVEIISDNTLGDSTLEIFITKHNKTSNAKNNKNNKYSYIEKLLIDAHGRGSGTDKGVLNDKAYKGQQNGGKMFLSSAFGWEGDSIDADKIDVDNNNSIKEFYNFIKDTMVKAWNDDLDVDGWVRLLYDFRKRIKMKFSQTFADSRYPINDVSLWDQTASTVAFFKTHLAHSLFDKNRCNPLNEDYQKKFRVLQVIIGGMDYLGQSNRIADLIYRKEHINRGFDSVRNVIEIEYPLGFEIYRDLDRITFLVPDQKDLKEMENCKGVSLEQIISDKFCGPQKENSAMVNEINVNKIVLSKIGTRNVFFIGEELQKDSSQTYLPGIEELKKIWQGKKADRCIVCQMRPRGYTKENANNGSRAYKRKICGICLERLNGRSKKWSKNLSGNTIWMDEVADRNGRVALITAKLDLAEWQNGKMISTLKNVSNKNNNKNENEYAKLTKELNQVDNDIILKNNGNLESLKDIIIPYIFKNKTKGELYNLQVKEEDLGDNNNLNDNEKLALAVWRKTPSFARIHRIWGTSRKFWNDIAEKFENSVGKRKSRIKIYVTLPEQNKIKKYHSYIAEIENEIRFTVVALNNGFYITENLQWLSSKIGADKDIVKSENDSVQFVLNYLKKYENIILYEFEQMNEKVGVLKINSIEKEKPNYLPTIRILEEPERFIAIVPAEKALNVVKNINEKYSIEMGKVRNRLPLTLGLIFAPSHTPLSVLMNAGERVLKMPVKDEIWKVEEIKFYKENEQGKYLIRIKKKKESEYKNNLDSEGKTEYEWYPQWEVNKNMGKDDKTEDQWYPFFCINKKDDTENRSKSYKGPDGYWLVHVSELEKNDEIIIKPSRFDFEFLDSSTRRYEISYSEKNGSVKRRTKGENCNYSKDDEWRLLCEGKANRPYYLEQINEIFKLNEILEKHLSKSQIYQIIESIENKRNEWGKIESQKNIKETFKNFVKITIKNAEWKFRPDIKDLDKIISAGISGLLKDTIEIYFKILKCNEEVGLNEK